MTDAPSNKQKIAILGGGMAAMTAAFELTNHAGWKDRYEVTVYQQGHRLGGKGASGRNRDNHDRIEEHGLHIWIGFYENAFRLIKECYSELGRNPSMPNATWKDAFKPHDFIVLEEQVGDRWRHWEFDFPRNDSEPGGTEVLPTGWDYLVMVLHWMAEIFGQSPLADKTLGSGNMVRAALDAVLGGSPPSMEPIPATMGTGVGGGGGGGGGGWQLDQALSPLELLKRSMASILGFGSDAAEMIAPSSAKAFLPVAHELAKAAPHDVRITHSSHDSAILKFVDHFARWLWDELKVRMAEDDDSRRLFISLDLGCAVVRGLIRDGIIFPPYDFRVIDRYDFKDWLRKHGATELTAESAPVRALYDLCFSSNDGMAAGMTLYCTLRMLLTYKGAIFYKMQGGMGDVVFAPMYTVLRRRGVKFKFFHRVRELHLSEDKQRVAAIDIGRQATLKRRDEYLPLFDVKGLPSWPSEPLYDQLVEGDELQAKKVDLEAHWTDWQDKENIRLELGKDFDLVVFGISVGAMPYLCKELIEHSKPLRDMVEHTKTIRTQALQLWLSPSLKQLGWRRPPAVVGCYEKPLDTWADMSFLIEKESWTAPNLPGNIAYFCALLDDEGQPRSDDDVSFQAREIARVEQSSLQWLTTSIRHLWPAATTRHDPEELNWDWLIDPEDRVGRERLKSQYIRANVNPSDCYVLTVPGSTKYRLRANQSGYANLFLAGDWLLTSINGGCIEAATMGGLQASRAICGYPRVIVGDLPPDPKIDMRPALPPAPPPRPKPLPPAPASAPGESRGLPTYIERLGDLILHPPFEQTGSRVYAFFFRAKSDALSAVCDRYLNQPAAGAITYKPMAPFVALVCANIAKIRSLDPHDAHKGWMSEQDIGFWIPVLAGTMDGDRFISQRACWFIPTMFVDRGLAVATGREIFGFPKQQSRIFIPRNPAELDEITVDTMTLPEYTPNVECAERRLLEVRHAPDSMRGPLAKVWSSLERVREDLKSSVQTLFYDVDPASGVTLPGPILLANLFRDALRERVRLVFLKQFRASAAGDRACYQAIIEANATVRALRSSGPLPGNFQLAIHPQDSHPIAEELGLEVRPDMDNTVSTRSVLSMWADFDFEIDGGTEVWRAR